METLGYVGWGGWVGGWAGWGWLGLAWLCRWLYYTFFENRLKAMAKSSTLSSWTWNKCGSEWQNWNSVLWTSKWTRSRAYPTTVGHMEVEEMEGRVKYLGQHYVYWCVSVVTHFREPAYERSAWFCFNSSRVYMLTCGRQCAALEQCRRGQLQGSNWALPGPSWSRSMSRSWQK